MIESRRNRLAKDIRRLRRCKGERALLEGPDLVAEALAAGLEIETLLATPDFLAGSEGRRLAPALPGPVLEISPTLLDELSDADSPRGLLAIARLPRGGAAALPARRDGVYVFLEGIQNPGNLGALVRVAEACGAAGVALSKGSVHPNHPRALRSSAGSLLRVPTAVGVTPDELGARLAAFDPRWLALTPRAGSDPAEVDLGGTLVLALGAEGPGLSEDLAARAAGRLTIPLEGRVESLNVAVAAALVLFEIRRRRRPASSPRPGS